MKAKRLIFVTLIIALLVLAMVGCGKTTTPNTTSSKVTLTDMSIERATFSAEYEGLEGDDFCIKVEDEKCETVAIRLELKNPDDYEIRYIEVNGTRILKADFRSDSTNKLIYALYTPDYKEFTDSLTDYESRYEYKIEVTEIAVAVGIVSEYVSIGNKGKETILIAPTFRLDLDYGLATQFLDSELDSSYIDVTYGMTIDESKQMISEYYMSSVNSETMLLGKCPAGYVFCGWFSEPNGKGKLLGYDDAFLYSSIKKLYAHYETQFDYEVISEEDKTARLVKLTSAGEGQSFLNIPAQVAGYTIVELGEYSLVKSSAIAITFSKAIKVVGNYACQGLIAKIHIEDGIESIGDYAFDGCKELVIGSALNNVESIGDYAFRGCVWDTVYNTRTYYDTLYLGEKLKHLGKGCFYQSGFLTVMVASNIAITADNIGAELFKYSANLENFYSAVELVTTNALELGTGGLVVLPNNCFQYCYKLKELKIGSTATVGSSQGVYLAEGLEVIGDSVFGALNSQKYAQLNTITLPNSLISIGAKAFDNSGLKDVIFTDGINSQSMLQSIGDRAFNSCAFTELHLYAPALVSVGEAIFDLNADLINLYIYAEQVPSFKSANSGKDQGFNEFIKIYVKGSLVSGYAKEWVTGGTSIFGTGGNIFTFISLQNIATVDKKTYATEDRADGTATLVSAFQFGTDTTITIPATINGQRITALGSMFAFKGVTAVSFESPENITEIKDGAFLDTALNSIDFSKLTNLESIGTKAFEETNITSFISGSDKLTYIGKDAFYRCEELELAELITTGVLQLNTDAFKYSGLKTVVLGTQITSIGSGVFAYCENLSSVYIQAEKPYTGNSVTYIFQGSTNVNIYYATEKIMNDFLKSDNYDSKEFPCSVKVYSK